MEKKKAYLLSPTKGNRLYKRKWSNPGIHGIWIFKSWWYFQDTTNHTGKNLFDDEQQSVAFVLGLKLLGGVMLANKENELFSGFQPAFVDLMKKLKGQK